MKLKTDRVMTADKVRQMCINHNYCTCCNNDEYSRLLENCDTRTTNARVLMIAKTIAVYSNIGALMKEASCSYIELIEAICFNLINECTYTAVEIEN